MTERQTDVKNERANERESNRHTEEKTVYTALRQRQHRTSGGVFHPNNVNLIKKQPSFNFPTMRIMLCLWVIFTTNMVEETQYNTSRTTYTRIIFLEFDNLMSTIIYRYNMVRTLSSFASISTTSVSTSSMPALQREQKAMRLIRSALQLFQTTHKADRLPFLRRGTTRQA